MIDTDTPHEVNKELALRRSVLYEINSELVLSTEHISRRDNELLNDACIELPRDDYEYGWRIWAMSSSREQWPEDRARLLGHGFSESFLILLDLARRLDCKWLTLDMDGNRHENLKQFEW